MNKNTILIVGIGLVIWVISNRANASVSKISNNGINFIKNKEGFNASRYIDESGKAHIGYGHLLTTNEKYKTISPVFAQVLLKKDLNIAVNGINRLINVPLNQNQFDSLVSFVYNIGVTRFSTSTIRKMLNNNEFNKAELEFSKWIFSGGNKSSGLMVRRKAELELFKS